MMVNSFMLLGIIIISLAWFNYVNLSTARFFERMKEVGIRKMIGASRMQLIFQFLVESFLHNAVAFIFALVLFYISWPRVTTFLGQEVPTTLLDIPAITLGLCGFIVLSTLISGIYPALFLSGFQPLQSLKGKITHVVDRTALRKALITFQFVVSIVLVTAVFALQRQINFMRAQDLGLSIDQTLVVEEPLLTDAATVEKFEVVKQQFLQIPYVTGVTYASSFPGAEIGWHRTDITLNEENADFKYDSRIISIGTEFLDVFDLPLQVGRNFSDKIESDKKAMLISEAASKMFGFAKYDEALSKVIFIGSRRFEIIGIVKDHHYRSLQNEIEPVLYMQGHPRNPRYAIKISHQHFAETIPEIEAKWKAAYGPNVFKYYFLDDFFDRQYATDLQRGRVVIILTFLTIFISCSGLFALSLYSVGRRAKEISIRKVFGATVLNVTMLLSKDFLKRVILGAIVAVPVSYKGISTWLQGYAYKMPLDGWLFIIPVGAVLILAIITTSFQTIAAAKKNPVENMKYE
jgi:putative ABC transport system permease protein